MKSELIMLEGREVEEINTKSPSSMRDHWFDTSWFTDDIECIQSEAETSWRIRIASFLNDYALSGKTPTVDEQYFFAPRAWNTLANFLGNAGYDAFSIHPLQLQLIEMVVGVSTAELLIEYVADSCI